MSDTISDEARVLANEILIKLVKDEKVTRIDCETEYLAPLLQSALTVARNKALDEVKQKFSLDDKSFYDVDFIRNAIDETKVQP